MNQTNSGVGVVAKIFGAIMIILGSMNCMLAWRGSFQSSDFFVLLIVGGIALFCFGAIKTSLEKDVG